MISMSSGITSKLFDDLWKRFSIEMDKMRMEHKADLKKLESSLSAALKSGITHIEGIIQLIVSSGMKSGVSGKVRTKTSPTEWEHKLDALTPNVDIIFNSLVFSRVICYNAPLTVVRVYTHGSGEDVDRASEAVQALLFSKQPSEKKFKFAGGVGKLHSDFKFTVVQNAFFNVCADRFRMFRAENVDDLDRSAPCGDEYSNRRDLDNSSQKDGVDGMARRITRPSWLSASSVTQEHIITARTFLERANQSRRGRIRDTPTPSDISIHGAERVYRLLSSHLHGARENVRLVFFISLGFLLVPWSTHISDVDQRKTEMKFEDQEFELNLDDVPDTAVCSLSADKSIANAADAANKELLKQLFSTCTGMILSVAHEVYVVEGNGVQRKHSGGKKRTLHRLINFIDVAVDVCVEFCRVGSREIFLRGHSSSLRCVMVVALLFKALAMDFQEMNISYSEFPCPEKVKVNATCLDDLVPGKNVRKSMLQSRCIRITRKEFEMLNHCPYGPEDGKCANVDRLPVFEGTTIQESDDLGIAAI